MTYEVPQDVCPIELVKRMYWLAWTASTPSTFDEGVGVDEAKVWAEIEKQVTPTGNILDWYGDFVFGRSLKMAVEYNKKNRTLRAPEHAYPIFQAWATVYPTYTDLFNAALRSLQQ